MQLFLLMLCPTCRAPNFRSTITPPTKSYLVRANNWWKLLFFHLALLLECPSPLNSPLQCYDSICLLLGCSSRDFWFRMVVTCSLRSVGDQPKGKAFARWLSKKLIKIGGQKEGRKMIEGKVEFQQGFLRWLEV